MHLKYLEISRPEKHFKFYYSIARMEQEIPLISLDEGDIRNYMD